MAQLNSPPTVERRLALRQGPLERYERMIEIRLLEDKILQLFADGLVPGSTHTSQGQEAVAVAVGAATTVEDPVTCTYRGHGIALGLGMEPKSILGEVLGRVVGSIGGVGGSMHLSDPTIGLLPTFAIVGAGLPVAVGAAVASRQQGGDAVAVAICGDGATNIGAFHESLNLAAAWDAPVLFLIENNLYGEFSPLEHTTPITDLYERGASYGMASSKVDGQDPEALLEVVQDQVDAIREGSRPRLLEVKTYRYVGHSRTDPATYRPEGELERWQERDPLDISRAQLLASGVATEDQLDALRADVDARIETAAEEALGSPSPELRAMFENVWSDGGVTGR